MNIIVTAKMSPGNFEPKFYPLIELDDITDIYVLRKEKGPNLDKINYIVLPKMCKYSIINTLLTPFILIYHTLKKKPGLIVSYHIIPHAFFACIAGKLTKTPYVVGQTGGKIELLCSKYMLIRYMVKYILANALSVNVPGENSKSFWEKFNIPGERINILHSVIDTNKFRPFHIKKKYDFIFVGAFIPRKRVDLIIKAFAHLANKYKQVNLILVGDGPEKNNLVELAHNENIHNNIFFYGYSRDIPTLLNESKIFVMASTIEGLPVALMEAMACELVVIAPDVFNNNQAVLDCKTGYLINNMDQNMIQERMEYVFTEYDKLKEIQKQARIKILQDHSIAFGIFKWKQILNNLYI